MRPAWRLGGIALAAVLAPSFAYGQEYAQPEFGLVNWTRLISGLIFCLLLSVAAAFLIKRYSGATLPARLFGPRCPLRPTSDLHVIETKRISPHADVCRFVSAGREYLVVLSPGGVALLRDVVAAADVTTENS
jgi:hypothetical protein